ncbi:MAG: alpha/beta fold hydrolase [Anaerolineaceae bacterium]|nr:alpha/beta fold hydrolase [Anaerolineaceae bacterium]
MKKTMKITLIIIFVLVLLIIGGLWGLSVYIYKENFDQRFESYEPQMLRVEDFEGLDRARYEFPSDKGQKLTGYLYTYGDAEPQAIVIIAHGFGGGGHNSYMDAADYFARNGFLVFAYDATGNDESEGKGVGGLPQGVIDLDYAITFVETSGNFPKLPIMLFGHSWGAYSAGSVLSYHPEVKAVIGCSGFNSSADMFEAEGRREAGEGIALFMPFVKLHEAIRYGKYASASVLNGLAASDARVMIVHGADDDFVPASIGYDRYYEKFADDPRFTFVKLDGQGHNYVFDDMTYINEFNAGFDKWLTTLDYDYKAKENKDRFAADKAAYIHQNLDREQWSHMLNKELFDSFVTFFRNSI